MYYVSVMEYWLLYSAFPISNVLKIQIVLQCGISTYCALLDCESLMHVNLIWLLLLFVHVWLPRFFFVRNKDILRLDSFLPTDNTYLQVVT